MAGIRTGVSRPLHSNGGTGRCGNRHTPAAILQPWDRACMGAGGPWLLCGWAGMWQEWKRGCPGNQILPLDWADVSVGVARPPCGWLECSKYAKMCVQASRRGNKLAHLPWGRPRILTTHEQASLCCHMTALGYGTWAKRRAHRVGLGPRMHVNRHASPPS